MLSSIVKVNFNYFVGGKKKTEIICLSGFQKWGSFIVQNAISCQNCQIYVKVAVNFVNFSKRPKISHLYVQFFTKMTKKGGHWVWIEEKMGSLGVRSA